MYLPDRESRGLSVIPRFGNQEVHVEHVISSLLGRYEKGTLTRRELIQGLAMLTVAGRTAAAADTGFSAATINHVSIQVSDIKRSAEFYMRAFGLPKRKAGNPDAIRLGVGPSHLTLRQEKPSGNVDHFCLGIDKFNRESVIRDLKARGVTPEPDEKGPQGFHVKDPDGFRIQLGDSSEF
jgi:catechol 2,3-dioxygenase-like lactoylglutathione lyase family enzyme